MVTTPSWSSSDVIVIGERGPGDDNASISYGQGIPDAVTSRTVAVPFNDAGAMSAAPWGWRPRGSIPACVIMDVLMLDLGVILPELGCQGSFDVAIRPAAVAAGAEVITQARAREVTVNAAGLHRPSRPISTPC